MTDLEALVKLINERGYIVFQSEGRYTPGDPLCNPVATDSLPFRFIVREPTDLADFLAQAVSLGWETADAWLGDRFYRCTTD